MKKETFLARALVAGACQYEFVAIATGRVPTISSLMWARKSRHRAFIWGVVVMTLTDHFFWRRFS